MPRDTIILVILVPDPEIRTAHLQHASNRE